MLNDLFKKARYVSVPASKRADIKRTAETDPELLIKCPSCSANIFRDEYERRLRICPACGHYARLGAQYRVKITCDDGSFTELYDNLKTENPIEFEGYEDKISKLQIKTGLKEAVLTGVGSISGRQAYIGVMDSYFMMASMGSVVGEKLTRLFEAATEARKPVILFAASGGARMQEGIFSLMQMAKVSGSVKKHSQAGLLYITVLTDPTTAGVTASFAMLGDIIIAEPRALVGFTGRRVIEGTISGKLPDSFQSSEFQQEHGFVDTIIKRQDMRRTLALLLALHSPAESGEKGAEADG